LAKPALKRPAATNKSKKEHFPGASAGFSGPVRFVFGVFGDAKSPFPKWNFPKAPAIIGPVGGQPMLVERGLRVMNVEVVGDAYAIASNYLRRAGAIPDALGTNERLLQIIVRLFQRGEFNRIRLANKAIAKFEADELV
jgi:hypothetical protein